MKNFKSFINEAGPNAKPKAKGEADFVDAHKVEISDPEEQGTDGSAKVTTKEGSGKRKADRLDNKQAMGEEVEEFDEELTADQIKKHKELAAKHRELAKSSGGEKRVAHQRAANLHVGATKNTWYKKGSTDAHKASKKLGVSEEVEELDELSKSTLASYAKKATHDSRIKHGIGKDFERIKNSSRKPEYKQGAKEWEDKYKSDARRREAGANKAIDRLAKEELELDELKKSTLASYVKKRVKQLPKIEVGYQMAPSDRDARMVKKYQSKVNKGIGRAVDRLAKEEFEELDEISKKTAVKAYSARLGREDDYTGPTKSMKTMDRIHKKYGAKGVMRAATAADKEHGIHSADYTKKDFVGDYLSSKK